MKTSASILTYPVRVWCVSPYISDTRQYIKLDARIHATLVKYSALNGTGKFCKGYMQMAYSTLVIGNSEKVPLSELNMVSCAMELQEVL